MINNTLIYFNIESRSGYPVPTHPDTEPGLDMGRHGNKFWNIMEMWNVVINTFLEYSMWLFIYRFSTTTEDRGSLTVEESLDMEDHFMRGGSIKERERSNLLGKINQKVCIEKRLY